MPLHPVGRDWRQTLAEDREAILLAEQLGFEEAFIGEHVTDLAETITSCLIFIATLARDTRRIRLGSGTVNLANRHPAVTAAEIAMVDTLLEGRFILGVGAGRPALRRGDDGHAGRRPQRAVRRVGRAHDRALDAGAALPARRGSAGGSPPSAPGSPELGQGEMLKPFQRPHPPIVVTAILPHSNGIAAAAARGWTPISANFVHPWVVKTHWPKYVEGCARARARGEGRGLARGEEHLRRRRRRDGAPHDARAGQPVRPLLPQPAAQGQAGARQRAFQARPLGARRRAHRRVPGLQLLIAGTGERGR